MPLSPLHYSNCHLTSWHREWYNSRPVFSSIYSEHLRQTGQEYGTFCSGSKTDFLGLGRRWIHDILQTPQMSKKIKKKKKHRLLEYYLYDPVSNVFLLAYGRLQVHNKSAKTLYLNDFHSLKYVSPSYFCFYPIITITNKTLTLCLCFIPKCTVYGTTERKN